MCQCYSWVNVAGITFAYSTLYNDKFLCLPQQRPDLLQGLKREPFNSAGFSAEGGLKVCIHSTPLWGTWRQSDEHGAGIGCLHTQDSTVGVRDVTSEWWTQGWLWMSSEVRKTQKKALSLYHLWPHMCSVSSLSLFYSRVVFCSHYSHPSTHKQQTKRKNEKSHSYHSCSKKKDQLCTQISIMSGGSGVRVSREVYICILPFFFFSVSPQHWKKQLSSQKKKQTYLLTLRWLHSALFQDSLHS